MKTLLKISIICVILGFAGVSGEAQDYIKTLDYTKLDYLEIQSLSMSKTEMGKLLLLTIRFGDFEKMRIVLEKGLNDIRLNEAVTKHDWVTVSNILSAYIPNDRVEALIGYMQGVALPQVSPQIFFTAIGECKNIKHIKNCIQTKVDCILLSVYQIDFEALNNIFDIVVRSDKQLILALDFQYEDIELLQLIGKVKDRKNIENEPLIHSIILLWGQQNAIDLEPEEYQKCGENARKMLRYIKSQAPEIYTYRQICLSVRESQGKRRDRLWNELVQVDTEGEVFWGPYYINAFNKEGKAYQRLKEIAKDKPMVYGSFFGYADENKLPKNWNDTEINEMKNKLPKLKTQWQREGWQGVMFIGLDNWLKVLK